MQPANTTAQSSSRTGSHIAGCGFRSEGPFFPVIERVPGDSCRVAVCLGNGITLATLEDYRPSERIANACLFAASNDMLEVLERIVGACQRNTDAVLRVYLDEARAVIAKAKGERA